MAQMLKACLRVQSRFTIHVHPAGFRRDRWWDSIFIPKGWQHVAMFFPDARWMNLLPEGLANSCSLNVSPGSLWFSPTSAPQVGAGRQRLWPRCPWRQDTFHLAGRYFNREYVMPEKNYTCGFPPAVEAGYAPFWPERPPFSKHDATRTFNPLDGQNHAS